MGGKGDGYAGHPPGWFYTADHDAWRRLTRDHDPRADNAGVLLDVPAAVSADAAFSRTSRFVHDDVSCLLLELTQPRADPPCGTSSATASCALSASPALRPANPMELDKKRVTAAWPG
ncbi:MAG: hypothetical protein ACYS0G_06485 [Planctomycetota bacterium]|jgi:hypothetical protein